MFCAGAVTAAYAGPAGSDCLTVRGNSTKGFESVTLKEWLIHNNFGEELYGTETLMQDYVDSWQVIGFCQLYVSRSNISCLTQ